MFANTKAFSGFAVDDLEAAKNVTPPWLPLPSPRRLGR
jgi:hypothetical protein